MRSSKGLTLFRVWDVLLIALILVLVGLTLYFFLSPKAGERAEIYVNGEKVAELSLKKDGVWSCEHLKVVSSKGKVWVEDADCPDKICQKHKAISKKGESIVCLPNRIVVKIAGKGEVEAIT